MTQATSKPTTDNASFKVNDYVTITGCKKVWKVWAIKYGSTTIYDLVNAANPSDITHATHTALTKATRDSTLLQAQNIQGAVALIRGAVDTLLPQGEEQEEVQMYMLMAVQQLSIGLEQFIKLRGS